MEVVGYSCEGRGGTVVKVGGYSCGGGGVQL